IMGVSRGLSVVTGGGSSPPVAKRQCSGGGRGGHRRGESGRIPGGGGGGARGRRGRPSEGAPPARRGPPPPPAPAPPAAAAAGPLDCGDGLLLLLRQRLDPLDRGQILELISTAASVEEDLPAWCRLTGNALVSCVREGELRSYYVCKGALVHRAGVTTPPVTK